MVTRPRPLSDTASVASFGSPLPRWGEGNRGQKSLLILVFFCLPWLAFGQSLPGTEPLDWQGDLSERMMDGAHRFVERKISESIHELREAGVTDSEIRNAFAGAINRQPEK